MKKILLLFFLLASAGMAHAQFGIRAGYSAANFSDTNFDTRSGFHLGAYYSIGAAFLKVEPGIQYAQKGYKTTDMSGDAVDEQLGYVDVPVLVRLDILPILNVFAGPQVSILASRNFTRGTASSTDTGPVAGYDVAGVFGAQVKLPLNLNLQASYDMGLKSLNYFDTDVKNRVFKVSVGYSFN